MTTNMERGPYETEAEAFAAAEPMRERLRLAYNYPGPMTEETRAARHAVKVRYVADALDVAGVELGAHDGHLVRWIARTWDPETIVVLLGWVERAYAAGQDAPSEDEAEQPVISWVLYRPQPGSDILEPAGVDGDVSFTLDAGELAVDKLIEYATGAPDHTVKVYGARGQLAAWAQWEHGEAVAYRHGGALEPVHALPPIDYPGRIAGSVPGPRCGAQDGRTALFAADVTCLACIALLKAEGTR